MLSLAIKSLQGRLFTVSLTVVAVALSVSMLLGVERLREAARTGFTSSITGIDLIVAARGDDLQILLATVFGIGATTNTVSWATYEDISVRPEVAWTVPIALGDTHAGFPVIGTTSEYFAHYSYGKNRQLQFIDGRPLEFITDAVIGAEVAETLNYSVGTTILNAHGAGEIETNLHEEAPFIVEGILKRTGMPVDRMVFVSLEGFAAIHAPLARPPTDPLALLDESEVLKSRSNNDTSEASGNLSDETEGEAEDPHSDSHASHADEVLLEGEHLRHHAEHELNGDLNTILVGLVAPEAALSVQRKVAEYKNEPLTGVLPAATLFRLWSITSVAESALRAVAVAVVLAGLTGLVVMFTATLEARRREFAILRSLGATPTNVATLVLIEALSVALAGIAVGLLLLFLTSALAGSYLSNAFGLRLALVPVSGSEYTMLALIAAAALFSSLIPAWRVFQQTLADGLSIRL